MTTKKTSTTQNPHDAVTDAWATWSAAEFYLAVRDDQEQSREAMGYAAEGLSASEVQDTIDVLKDVGDIMVKRETAASLVEKRSQYQMMGIAKAIMALTGMTQTGDNPGGGGQLLMHRLLTGALLKKVQELETELELARLGDSAPPMVL